MTPSRQALLALLVGSMLVPIARAQPPAGTAFSYQGRLLDGGSPANGAYDLQFALFDAPSDGTQVGATIVRNDVAVAAGLFTVGLDFGPEVFIGYARWLQVGVRPGAGTGAFTPIGPRQEIQPAPHAGFAATAPWSGLTLVPAGFADGIDNDSGGDITGVTAGTGLTGGGAAGAVTVGVDFTGSSGSSNASSRADHHHLGQAWNGTGPIGLSIHNTGTALDVESASATAVIGDSSATSGVTNGVWGRSLSTVGRGVHGQSIAATGPAYGVYGTAASPDGTGVYGGHLATTGIEPAVMGETSSTSGGAVGVLGQVTPAAPGGNSAAVRGINNGTGALGIGVWGSQAGSGWGVSGTTASGIGVRGSASSTAGVGVRAQGAGTAGTALEIGSGAIRVPGAGVGTGTVAFVHRAFGGSNTCASGSHVLTPIDNPYTNGDSTAILIVTHSSYASFGLSGQPSAVKVGYGTICGVANRWGILWDPTLLQEEFNVLVIKP
jgi:hypothetical protein